MRKVILRGVLEISCEPILGIVAFLVILAGILVALPRMSRFFEQSRIANPETIEKT